MSYMVDTTDIGGCDTREVLHEGPNDVDCDDLYIIGAVCPYILKVKQFAESAFQSQKICGKNA